jgi:hypothetical protein
MGDNEMNSEALPHANCVGRRLEIILIRHQKGEVICNYCANKLRTSMIMYLSSPQESTSEIQARQEKRKLNTTKLILAEHYSKS